MKKNLMQLALESGVQDGEKKPEIEYVVFARLIDRAVLAADPHPELQEQWQIPIGEKAGQPPDLTLRIRKSGQRGIRSPSTYVQTIKTPPRSVEGGPVMRHEIETPSSFEAFGALRACSKSGMVKERYRFPIPGTELVWEMDVFPKDDGTYSEWVKIDLEVKAPLSSLPPLPPGLADAITNQWDDRTDEEKMIIDNLFKTEFRRSPPAQ